MADVKVWAHRGAGGWDKQYAPENTMPAFEKAIEMGADGIELDVQFSKDGEIVICHDETIDRTSNGVGAVRAYTLKELKQFNFCSVHPEFGFVESPTLREVLEFMQEKDFQLNIELKTSNYDYPGLEEAASKLVKEYGLNDRVIYSSFGYASLKKLRKCDKDAQIAILCSTDFVLQEDVEVLQAIAIHPWEQLVTAERVKKWHEWGVKVNTWTVDNPQRMKEILTMDVDAMITDCPDNGRRVASEM
ncbi:glycerophosphodiester phosphodiesterase [Selenomonas ruminantium]|uniref:glycerophosphodiester phosphodiesterase n=1 Tax=Selenomonas ruminantium TaxID=971 RepID=UPI00047BA1DF|nr:glycerophosphodiester phosphodiesterase [Selenomonas ruminantium]